jgi:hypothetical protein
MYMGRNPLDNSISPARLSPRSRYGSPGRRGILYVWLFVTRIWNQIISGQKHISPNPSASFVGSSPKGEPKHPSSCSNEWLQQITPKHVHILQTLSSHNSESQMVYTFRGGQGVP